MGTDNATNVAKAVAMFALFTASMTLGSVPVILTKKLKIKGNLKTHLCTQLLLCFGGGVLMCTTFLHILPEVAENLQTMSNVPDIGLPIAELLMCCGFFIMYFIEEVVHGYLTRNKDKSLDAARRSISISHNVEFGSIEEPTFNESKNNNHAPHSHQPFHLHHHSHMGAGGRAATAASIRGFLIVLALSVHELFEGLAIGLESSSSTVWYMFGAVSAHKFVIAFCIGTEMVTSGMRGALVLLYIFIFAVVSPMGIGVGLLLTENSDNADGPTSASVILQGLATGTLLYVVFFEILKAERRDGIKHYFAVLIGFVVMAALTLLDDD